MKLKVLKRFWKKVDKNGPVQQHVPELGKCWEWTGYRHHKRPYGNSSLNGRNMAAHRLSYMIEFGEIPTGMCVLHKCDNPPCVRPSHLFIGTNKDNVNDRTRKGRSLNNHPPSGEKHWNCRFSKKEILDIFKEYHTHGKTVTQIADDRKAGYSHIFLIVSGNSWTHVTGATPVRRLGKRNRNKIQKVS
jgi:hypothetical protein